MTIIPSVLQKNNNQIFAGFAGIKQPRNSNLELYRIICMLMIVAHHYVVNSGLDGPLSQNPNSTNSLFLLLFGMWGKTGINCFLMITGYFIRANALKSWKISVL